MVKHRYFLINFCYVKNNANKFVFLNFIHNHISCVVLLSCWPFETLNANKTLGIMRITWYSILLRNISYLWYTFKEAYIAASLKLWVNMGLLMRMLSFHRTVLHMPHFIRPLFFLNDVTYLKFTIFYIVFQTQTLKNSTSIMRTALNLLNWVNSKSLFIKSWYTKHFISPTKSRAEIWRARALLWQSLALGLHVIPVHRAQGTRISEILFYCLCVY